MSRSTRRAIAGTAAGCRLAHEGCEEAIRRYDACRTNADIRAVLDWSKERGGWLLRSSEDDRRMKEAFNRARLRCGAAAQEGTP
jgi:hypothetical protein